MMLPMKKKLQIILIGGEEGDGDYMLSIVDIKKELGNNIYLYPVHIESIKANSIDLHVSKFAWSLNTKKRIDSDGYVVIPPNDTGLIYTEESIYVSDKIGGSYHSKVTIVCKGAGHIGTTLDAQYIGCSLIAMHNHSADELKLKIGSEFVTIHFWYLNSPTYSYAISHDNAPGHPRILNGYNGVEDYIEWKDQNAWTTRQKDLFHKMEESEEFKKCKEEYQIELDQFNKRVFRTRTKQYIKAIGILLIVFVLLSMPAYIFDFGGVSTIFQNLLEKVALPLLAGIIGTFGVLNFQFSKKE